MAVLDDLLAKKEDNAKTVMKTSKVGIACIFFFDTFNVDILLKKAQKTSKDFSQLGIIRNVAVSTNIPSKLFGWKPRAWNYRTAAY